MVEQTVAAAMPANQEQDGQASQKSKKGRRASFSIVGAIVRRPSGWSTSSRLRSAAVRKPNDVERQPRRPWSTAPNAEHALRSVFSARSAVKSTPSTAHDLNGRETCARANRAARSAARASWLRRVAEARRPDPLDSARDRRECPAADEHGGRGAAWSCRRTRHLAPGRLRVHCVRARFVAGCCHAGASPLLPFSLGLLGRAEQRLARRPGPLRDSAGTCRESRRGCPASSRTCLRRSCRRRIACRRSGAGRPRPTRRNSATTSSPCR